MGRRRSELIDRQASSSSLHNAGPEDLVWLLDSAREMGYGYIYKTMGLRDTKVPPLSPTPNLRTHHPPGVNYTGSFSSPGDPVLESVWWAAAYTVRATLQADYMGSILMDRGDRFSWAGDAHPSQATAMAAFSPHSSSTETLWSPPATSTPAGVPAEQEAGRPSPSAEGRSWRATARVVVAPPTAAPPPLPRSQSA
jgi:hypothetical protein